MSASDGRFVSALVAAVGIYLALEYFAAKRRAFTDWRTLWVARMTPHREYYREQLTREEMS